MISENEIKGIVNNVIKKLDLPGSSPSSAPAVRHSFTARSSYSASPIYSSMDDAIKAAAIAQEKLVALGLEKRKEIIQKIREYGLREADRLGKMSVEETGLGKMPDKMQKIRLVLNKTPGVEDIESKTVTGDRGLTLSERAPYGVFGVITPSTNPTETVFNNAIGFIAAGNSGVFNPHPGAKKVSQEAVKIINQAVIDAGGPPNVVTVIKEPTQETAQEIMKNPLIKLLLVTGGGEVVKFAMTSGKKTICGGPGNPPVVVDETADITLAAEKIIFGAQFDNNVLCIAEKEVFVVEAAADRLKNEMTKRGAYEIKGADIDKLVKAVIANDPDPKKGVRHPIVNKKYVGKTAIQIAQGAGINVPRSTKVIIFEVPWDHVMVMAEQLMPALPVVRCKDVNEAINYAVLAEQNCRHTFSMFSTNVDNMSKLARLCNASIFVKNGPTVAGLGFGGEGHTTMTIASPTGEGITKASTFTRERRCVLVDRFRIV